MSLSAKQVAGRSACLVTASEIPALMGEDSRTSYFELWNLKAGLLEREHSESEAMAWGNALEAPIARQVAKNQGWKIRKVERHLTLDWTGIVNNRDEVALLDEAKALRHGFIDGQPGAGGAAFPLGASLDYEIARGFWAPLEIKAVGRFASRGWENGQPPLPVLLQVQGQLACASAPLGVAAGLRSVTGPEDAAEIPRHEETIKLIFRAVLELEVTLARGEAPPPDLDRTGDVEAVFALHKAVTSGKVLDLRQDARVEKLLGDYRLNAKVKGNAEKEANRLWAELLLHLGPDADFDELIGNESKASRWTVPAKEQAAYIKKAYASYGVYRRKT